jgi:tripartite-type tricarboxylate transporter receptor subunit TctC
VSRHTRRTFLVAACAATLGFGSAFAAYPDKPIRLVVPYGGGGMGTLFGSMVTEVLHDQLKTPAFAEYKGGAQGAIGAREVAKSPPDGYTLLMVTTALMAVNPNFLPNLPYDPVKDFVPVGVVWMSRNVLFSRPDIKSLKDLVELGRKKSLTYGSLGPGSLAHLSAEMLLREAKIQAVHVPFKGNGQIMTELAGGRLDFAFTDPSGLPLSVAGKVKALAVTGKERLPSASDVPTMVEQGYPNVGTASWIAIMAPAGTPREVVEKISNALSAGFADEALRAKVAAVGAEVAQNMTPQYFERELRSELARWKKFQQESKITVEQ